MDLKLLYAVEKWTYGLGVVAMAIAFVFVGGAASYSIALGAGLMGANAYVLRRIGVRAFRSFSRPSAAILLFNLKMGVLLAIVFAIVKYLNVSVGAFLIGLSVFPLAIVAVAIEHAIRPLNEDEDKEPANG